MRVTVSEYSSCFLHRDDVHVQIGHKGHERLDHVDYSHRNKSIEYIHKRDKEVTEIDSRIHVTGLDRYDDEEYNDTDLPKDLMAQQAEENKPPRPVFQVEVEEWDTNPPPVKPAKTGFNSSQAYTNGRLEVRSESRNFHNYGGGSSNISKSYNVNTRREQNNRNIVIEGNYTTVFCHSVLGEADQKPAICRRELVEFGSTNHVNISKYSVHFRELGDIFVFSAFLDIREKTHVIRLMTLGRQGRDKSKSTYWCVFYSGMNETVLDPQFSSRQATQLSYLSASDGHQKYNQFYIMSCLVPDSIKFSLLAPHRSFIEIVTGNFQRPFLDKVQERLPLRVIRNNPESWSDITQKRSYFDKMEQDLLTLNVPEFRITGSSIRNSNNISNVNNIRSGIEALSSSIRKSPEGLLVQNSSNENVVTCVAPLQGSIAVVQIVEFIELTFLLGSQHIVFYTFHISNEIKNALNMYERRGLVTVLPWNIPSPESVWANGRDMALNDCLYRTMHVYDYALFLDLDEFLVPRITSDIPSFLKYLKSVHRFNSTRFSDLVFSSTYFPPPTKVQFRNLTTVAGFTRDINKFVSLKSVYRTYFNPKHTLRMIRLSMAFRVGAGERKRTSFTVSSRFAVVNHYSYCPQEAGAKANSTAGQFDNRKPGAFEKPVPDICSHMKQDFTMWRYKNVLIQRVRDSVRKLNQG